MNIFKRPMFYAALVCSVTAGIALFAMPIAITLVVVAIILLLLYVIFNKKYKYITVLIAIVLFVIGLGVEIKKINQVNVCDGQKFTGNFLLTEEITDHDAFNTIVLKPLNCDNIPQNIKILVFDYEKLNFKMGDIINGTIDFNAIDKYDEYRLSNYSSGIFATADVVELTNTGNYNRFYKTAANIRNYVKSMSVNHSDGDTAGLLLALTTGDKSLLSDGFLANVKTTGISHVIVVSGMHLSIIMAAVFWCIDRLFYNKYIRCLLSVAIVAAICAVCGFTMSIVRAGVMFLIAGLAPIFNRDNDSLSSLLTAVVLVLISAPFAIFNISFQLSVLSTLAIIWVVPFYSNSIKNRFAINSKIIKFLLDTTLCSTFAIIFTLPVTIKIFGYMSIVSPITNLIISYPVMLALILNILALIFSVIPVVNILSTFMYMGAGLCSKMMVFSVNNIAKLPITVAVLPKVAFWWSLIVLLVVIVFMYIYKFKKKRSDLNANSI